jgi:DNA-binding NarL/FixJ family response regulator
MNNAGHIRIALQLSLRQRRVLTAIAEGETTKGIALSLHISPKTVEYHREALMKRTHLQSVPELTRLAVRLGLADINP